MWSFIGIILAAYWSYGFAQDQLVDPNLSIPTAEDCTSFTRLMGRIKPEYTFQQLENITDSDCRSICISLNTCRSFSQGFSQNGNLECALSSWTIEGKLGLFDDNGTVEEFTYYEKSEEGCMELAFDCGADIITVQGRSTEPFTGFVYPESAPGNSCRTDISNQTLFSFVIRLDESCGINYSGNGTYANVLMIESNEIMTTRKDRRFKVSCQYDLSNAEIRNEVVEISQSVPLEMNMQVARPEPIIRLINMDATGEGTARVGDNMMLRIEPSKTSPYGMLARSCKAQGEHEKDTLDLIDEKGCPVRMDIFPRLQRNGTALVAQFLAFRFKTSVKIFFECNIHYCLEKCPPVDCSGLKSFGRRRRRDLKNPDFTIGQQLLIASH